MARSIHHRLQKLENAAQAREVATVPPLVWDPAIGWPDPDGSNARNWEQFKPTYDRVLEERADLCDAPDEKAG